MAGEFGRAVSDLGAGLMARSERRRELEDQRKYAEEQRKREEEAFARKQKVLADIKAEQEGAKEAAKKAEELGKAQRGELNIGRDGEIIRKYVDETGMPAFEVVRPGTPKQRSVSPLTVQRPGDDRPYVYDRNTWERIGLPPQQPPQLTTSDLKISDLEGRLAGAQANRDYLSANKPEDFGQLDAWNKDVRNAQAEIARYERTLEGLRGKPFTLSDDGLTKPTPLMEADPFQGGGYTDRMDQARAQTTPAPAPGKKERIGDAAARVDAILVKENDPMLANAFQIALDRLRVQKQKDKQAIVSTDYDLALEWARRNKDRVGQYFGEE